MRPWWLSFIVLCACADHALVPTPTSGDFVGTWRFKPLDPTRTPVEELEVVELRGDGTYSIRDRHGTATGIYEVDGRAMTLRSDAGGFITTGFAATADRLVVDALFRDGAADDLTGRWIGEQSSEAATTTVELELRADGTARIEQSGEVADVVDATWIVEDPYVVVTYAGSTRTKALPVLGGTAIGEWLYTRIE